MQPQLEVTTTLPVPQGATRDKNVRRTHTSATRTRYIFRGEDKVDYLIETSEGYCNRRKLSQRSSSIKKLARMMRVRERGFVKRKASEREITIYGPAINIPQDEA